MKTISTLNTITLVLSMAFMLTTPLNTIGQNLLSNSNFSSGTTPWNVSGMTVEVNRENVYGGPSNGNRVAEIDNVAGLRQKVAITPGKVFQLNYKASRRTSGATPANPGITVQIIGDVTSTSYLTNSKVYTNTTFAYTNEVLTFSVPASSTDNIIVVQFTGYNNSTTLGVIVDDITLTVLSSLPVQLISFTAELRNGQTALNWKTASELNNKHFVVERSGNGSPFDSIGMVQAAPNNNSTKSYTFTDTKINNGTNFYRLRQVDIDGSYSYSKVVTVKGQKDNGGVKIFPTMATTHVNVNLTSSASTIIMVSVYDASGKTMIRTNKTLSTGVNQQSIDIASLAKGAYYLHIQDNSGNINFTQAFHKVN